MMLEPAAKHALKIGKQMQWQYCGHDQSDFKDSFHFFFQNLVSL